MLRQPGWFNLLQCLQADGKAGVIPRVHEYDRNTQEIKGKKKTTTKIYKNYNKK